MHAAAGTSCARLARLVLTHPPAIVAALHVAAKPCYKYAGESWSLHNRLDLNQGSGVDTCAYSDTYGKVGGGQYSAQYTSSNNTLQLTAQGQTRSVNSAFAIAGWMEEKPDLWAQAYYLFGNDSCQVTPTDPTDPKNEAVPLANLTGVSVGIVPQRRK